MARRRGRRAELPLPWERSVGGFREMLFGRRTLPAAVIVASALALLGIYELGTRHVNENATLAAVAEMQRAARAFVVELDRCPRTTTELVHPPKSGVHYLQELPQDAWGNDLYLECSFDGQPVVTVLSPGPSGSLFTDDNLP